MNNRSCYVILSGWHAAEEAKREGSAKALGSVVFEIPIPLKAVILSGQHAAKEAPARRICQSDDE